MEIPAPRQVALLRRAWSAPVAIVALVVLLLPWSQSGQVTRNGFALATALGAGGFLTAWWEQALVLAARLIPVIAALSIAAALLSKPQLARATAGLSVLIVAIAAIVDFVAEGPSALVGPCGALLLALLSGVVVAGPSIRRGWSND